MNLDADGFDHYGSELYVQKYWNGVATSIEDGRLTGGPASIATPKAVGLSNSSITRVWGTSEAELVCGFAFRTNSVNDAELFAFKRDGTTQIGLQLTSAGTLRVYREFTFNLIGVCSGSPIVTDTWCYIEVKCKIHPSIGTVEVRKNGEVIGTFGPINTAPATPLNANVVQFGGAASFPAPNLRFDDFYLNAVDGSGVDDDFMGDIAVHTLIPLGNGATNNFTPVGEASNFACVDNIPPDDASTYVRGVSGNIDEYVSTSYIHTSFNIRFLRTVNFSSKTDVGPLLFKHRIRVNAAIATSAGINSTPDFEYSSALFRFNPDGLGTDDWNKNTISLLNFGVEVA